MPHDVVIGPGAGACGLQAVRLHQQRRAILNRGVDMRIARAEDLHEKLALAVHVAQAPVGSHQMAVGRHALVKFRNEFVAHPGAGRFGEVLVPGHVPVDVVLHVGAVGDVIINQKIGIPGVEDVQPGAHLRRVCLDVIAVQVETLGRVAQAGIAGTILLRAMVRAEIFVTVDVENGDDHEDGLIQPGGQFLSDGHIANQHEDGVLALDFAGVNAALDHDDGLVGFGRGFGREGAILGNHQRDHGAPFGCGADVEHLDE